MSTAAPILKENCRRIKLNNAVFDPLTGEGSIGQRKKIKISDHTIPIQYVPLAMLEEPLLKEVLAKKSIAKFLKSRGLDPSDEKNVMTVQEGLIRARCRHDFAFWAILFVIIKDKISGLRIHFKLNAPQRKLVELFESMRLSGVPIRVVLLKARQWGGSTVTQLYMAWIQLCLTKGRNSAIIAHQLKASYGVRNMFKRMAAEYPVSMLYEIDEEYGLKEKVLAGSPSPNVIRIPARECEIDVGSAESPESERSASIHLAHLTEVAFFPSTDNHNPEQIVRSISGTVPLAPLTLIVLESTANGTGNFFQESYDSAKGGEGVYRHIFIAWWQIEMYSLPFKDDAEREAFADWLIDHRNQEVADDNRHEPGRYLWWLWNLGATLEAIHWYVTKRTEFHSHAGMAAEYPSDDVEAFVNSGKRIFDMYSVEKFKGGCKPPRAVGELHAKDRRGKEALENIHFVIDANGNLWIWDYPEIMPKVKIENRYLVIVDIGGRSANADWSVITVIDRFDMMEGGKPCIVAQWYGHVDHDILAWKAAQIAKFYDDALLVIESNTLETKDKNRDVDGDQSSFILNEIKREYTRLYARKQSAEDIRNHAPVKFGFHTNTKTKGDIISLLIEVIREGEYIERDKRCLDEYLTYEEHDGSFDAIAGKHDDLLMTRAIGLWICFKEMPRPEVRDLTNDSKVAYTRSV